MTRSQFFKHFELLADQPDAVAKMRELVLELAVRGKLVSNGTQADKDGAWTKFCAEATAKNSDLSPAFSVPSHWRWARLEDVAAPCGQKKPDARFTYVDVGAIDNERGVIKDDVEVVEPENAPSRARKLVAQNSVIYSTVRPYLKNIAIVDRKFSPSAIVSTAFAVLHPVDFLQSRYLYYWLRSRPFQSDVESKMKGVAYPAISDSELWQCLIPVPPPAEQRRIVAKVDELMALCDELRQRQQARQHARGLLQQSALHHLLAAREPATFAAAWQRVRDHFHLLHDTPDAIPQLRQAILSLAVQGHLVDRIEKEGTGGEILNGIEAKPITPADAPFLPDHWKWAALGDLVVKMDSGWSPACPPEPAADNQWGVLKTTAVQSVRYLQEHNKVLPRHLKPRPEHEVMKGDILITRAGPKNRVGISCVVESTRPRLMISDKIVRFQLRPIIFPRFAALCLNAGYSSEVLERLKSGMAESQMNISQPKLKTTPLPVPPFAEQKRIVARVEELLRWCDTLEAQLHQTRTLGAHLLNSTLHHLLAA